MNLKFKYLVISHGLQLLNENPDKIEDKDELHNFLFNEDYFVIGYYEANNILKDCDFCPFDAISEINEFDLEIFGEITLKPNDINSEKVVNLLAYYYGMEFMGEILNDYAKEN